MGFETKRPLLGNNFQDPLECEEKPNYFQKVHYVPFNKNSCTGNPVIEASYLNRGNKTI